MTEPLFLALIAAIGYLCGSIPFGLLLTKAAGLGDIRNIGSGNIGATNVLRTGKKGLAVATLLLDALKAVIPVLLVIHFHPDQPLAPAIVGFSAVLGHLYPVWLKFKGGKGVATTLGVLLAACWPAGLIACGTWLAVAFTTRYSSLSALIALALAPLFAWYFGGVPVAVMAALLAALVWWKHKDNIKRLLAGTEPKIGKKNDT